MAEFETPLRVEITSHEESGRMIVTVLLPFLFELQDTDGDHIPVEAGFNTDFASVPRPFWTIFPPLGPWAKAAVIHDWMCVNRCLVNSSGARVSIPSTRAAAIFHQAMVKLRVDPVRAYLMWAAVRVFGPQWA